MNQYGLNDHFKTRNGEIEKMVVERTGYYSSGGIYKEKDKIQKII